MTKSVNHNIWLWDNLANYFNTNLDEEEIHPDAAVNIHIGWPVYLNQIETQSKFLDKNELDILDFGCGVGSLCMRLHKAGHNVTGIDYSTEMLDKARRVLPTDIKLYQGNHKSTLLSHELASQFDIITAMHVFDWIREVPTTISNVSKALRNNGILLFSVFPEKHIIDSLYIKDLFEDFDSNDKPKKGYANFDGIRVPVYVKTAAYYDKLAKKAGLEKVLEYYPPYPKEFLNKYKWTGSLYPEMLILAYRKIIK